MYNLKRWLLFQVMVVCSLVLGSGAAFAGTISLSKASDTTFEVVANGLGAPSGVDLTVTYDSSKLGNPRVDRGGLAGGAMLAANTGVAGKIRMALVSHPPMGSSGTLVTITFDKLGDSSGDVGVSGTAITQTGATIAVAYSGYTDTANQTAGGAGTSDSGTVAGGSAGSSGTTGSTGTTTTTTVTRGTGSGISTVGGTLSMPTDDTGMARKDAAEPASQAGSPEARETFIPTPSAGAAAAPEAPAVAKKHEKYRPYAMTSVLEKFRLYTGEKTPQNLMALFGVDTAAPITQDPQVVIADGKSTVTVLISHVPGEKAPNFSFSHARYVSMQQAGEGEWQLEVRPEKGALRASVTMLVDGVQQEIPLTVAPKVKIDLDKSGKVAEADFQRFLKSRGTGKAPEFDLNGDGKRDYLDDYLFTANYLARQDGQSQK